MRGQTYDRNDQPFVTQKRREDIRQLYKKGRSVVELTPFQYRIDGIIDLFPISGKFHNIKTNEWGIYPAWTPKDLMEIHEMKKHRTTKYSHQYGQL